MTKVIKRHKKILLPLLLTAVIFGGIGAYLVFFSSAATTNTIYRLVNSNGIHILTTSTTEKDTLVGNGWTLQLSRTYTPVSSSGTTPFSRLFNPDTKARIVAGPTETSNLVAKGWTNSGIKFYSVKGYAAAAPYGFCRTPWYRLFKSPDYFFTPSATEANKYVSERGYTLQNSNAFELYQACTTNPAPPPPPPAPTPTPTPTPTPAPTPTPTPTAPSQPRPAPRPAPAPTAPVVSSSADATVTAGTLSAHFTIPAGNAQTIHVIYGIAADKLDNKTDTQTVTGSDTTLTLKNLNPLTTYNYQVVRTSGGQTKNSVTAAFQTTGYDLVINYINSDESPVSDITAKIQNPYSEMTTDTSGTVRFTNVPAGTYSVEYSYDNQNYTETIDTANPTNSQVADQGQVLFASSTIDVSQLGKTTNTSDTEPTSRKSSKLPLVLGLLLLLGLVGSAIVFIRRRRAASAGSYDYIVPPTTVNDPNIHPGESLKDMVIKSMREEAARKQQRPPEDPEA